MSAASVVIPCKRVHELSGRRFQSSRPLRGRTAQRVKPAILVVDDEPLLRRLLQAALEVQGFTVWLAADGREALQIYQRHRLGIDLVLLDVLMPGLDGPQTLAALQMLEPAIACCFMTGFAGDYTYRNLLEQGALRVFAKPFRPGELGASLWQLVARVERHGA